MEGNKFLLYEHSRYNVHTTNVYRKTCSTQTGRCV